MPIPADYKAQAAQKVEYEPLEEGIYQVEIADVSLVDKPKFENRGESEQMLDFEFVILDDGQYRGRRLWKTIRPVINQGGNGFKASYLYELMCKAMKLQLTQEDALDVPINSLLGKQLVVAVDCKPGKNGKTYNNIRSFTAVKELLDPFEKSESPAGSVASSSSEPVQSAREVGRAGRAMAAGGAPVAVPGDAEVNVDDIPF
jgi:hypothetical protein